MIRCNVFTPILLVSFAVLGGCSTHTLSMKYHSTVGIANFDAVTKIAIGEVVDSRNTSANWLGAIRGGYGNALKKIVTDVDTADAIAVGFAEGLRARGLLAGSSVADYHIDVELIKFDASQTYQREVHANFIIAVDNVLSGETVFSRHYRKDKIAGGVGPGIFGSPSVLAALANVTLNESIDEILDDPEFLRSIQSQSNLALN